MLSYSSSLDIAYNEFKKLHNIDNWTPASFIILVMAVMQIIEVVTANTDIKGNAKQQLAIDLIKKIITETKMSPQERQAAEMAVDTLLPALIDSFVKIDHEKLFKTAATTWKKLFPCCFSST